MQKTTLKSAYHAIWENIKNKISVEWPHLFLAQEEVDLILRTRKEIERITKEMQDKPHKCKILIQWLNSKSVAELSNHGVRDRTTMIMQANQVVNKLKLCNIAKQQSLEQTNQVKAFKSSFNSVIR